MERLLAIGEKGQPLLPQPIIQQKRQQQAQHPQRMRAHQHLGTVVVVHLRHGRVGLLLGMLTASFRGGDPDAVRSAVA